MENQIEKLIKITLLVIILLAGLSYWLIPRSRWRSVFQMNEKVFIITQAIGVFSGILGLCTTFIFPNYIIELHLWELLIMPYFLIYVYWLIVMKLRKAPEITDEKQEYDMGKAGGVSFALSIFAMVILFSLSQNGLIQGLIWFPIYIFITILFFSGFTLFYFKK